MRTNLRAGLRLLAVLLVVVLLGAIALTCCALVIESQASGLLRGITALKVGISTGTDALQFAQRHQWLISGTSNPCTNDTCSMIFSVQNKWLSALRLEPPAMFQANFSVSKGTVISIGAFLIRSMPIFPTFSGAAGVVNETVELPKHLKPNPHYYFPTPVGKPYLRIAIDSDATPVQLQRAFDFSFWCLVKPGGGCDLPCDYLPTAWQDWKASLRDAGWPQGDFDRAYPNNARCSH
jgi:hypothetical protein